jgi:hypothetical protein
MYIIKIVGETKKNMKTKIKLQTNKFRNLRLWQKGFAASFVVALFAAMLSAVPMVSAAALTNMWAVETNMDATGTGGIYFAFKAGTTGVPGTISFALTGTGASVAATNANLGTTTSGCTTTFSFLASVTALPGTLTATGSGATISLTGGTSLTSGTNYCVGFTGAAAVTNPSSAGVNSYTISDTSDSGTAYYVTLSSGTNNTINVTATVPQTFTLSLSSNSDPLGNLAPGSVITSTGLNAQISTNALNGFGLWAYDSSTGLHSTNASHTIASTSPGSGSLQTLSAGTEGYVTNASYNSGSATGTAPTTTTPFTGAAGTGDGLNGTPAEIASGTGSENGATIKIKESAAISNITPEATDYSDNVTVVGAGSF